MQIKPASFDTEKNRVIKHWKETVIDSMKNSSELNRGYLLAASIICELCVKDVYEQILPLFSFLKDETEQIYLEHLLSDHYTRYLIDELSDLTYNQYCFPEIYKELDSMEIDNILYHDIDINLNKKDIKELIEKYIKCHDKFLKDYNQKLYNLKLALKD